MNIARERIPTKSERERELYVWRVDEDSLFH